MAIGINSSLFYNPHLELTKQEADQERWAVQVGNDILPAYREELHEPYEECSLEQVSTVAQGLKQYYEHHRAARGMI